MKLVQLLSGAAAVALMAGAASAQAVTVTAGAGNFEEDTVLAAEFTGAVSGDLVLGLDFDAAFASLGAGGEVDMVVTLLNAEFDGIVSNAPDGFTDNNCDFNIISGGGAGGSTVTFRNASTDLFQCVDAGPGTADSSLTLPIAVSTVGQSVDVSVAFVRNSGSAGYGGTTANFDLIDYTAVTSYTLTGNPDASELLVTGTTLIDWSAVALLGDQGFLGNFASAAVGTADVDIDGTAATYAAVVTDDSELVFGFTDVTNITGVTPSQPGGALDAGTTCAAPDAVANTITCTIDEVDVNDSSVNALAFTLDISGALEVVAPQTITATFTPDEEANFTDTGASDASFALLDEDDGVSTTTIGTEFPWASLRDTGGTKSAFRITGLEANPSVINVILNSTYARSGATAPGVATADITSVADIQEDPLNTGEFIATFTSEDIAGVLGTSGGVNADIQFSVTLPDGTGTGDLEAHRLLSTGGLVAGSGFDN